MSVTTVINCLPHEATIYAADKTTVIARLPPSSCTVRMIESSAPLPADYAILGCNVPLVGAPAYTAVSGLPPRSAAPILVSMPVGEFAKTHPEMWHGPVLGVDMGREGAVRDEKGVVRGTTRFIVYKP